MTRTGLGAGGGKGIPVAGFMAVGGRLILLTFP
jgi:hypothetical protein